MLRYSGAPVPIFTAPRFSSPAVSASQSVIQAINAVKSSGSLLSQDLCFVMDAAFSSAPLRGTITQLRAQYSVSANVSWDFPVWHTMRFGLEPQEFRVFRHPSGEIAYFFRDKDSEKGPKYYQQFTTAFDAILVPGAIPSPVLVPAVPLPLSTEAARILASLPLLDLRSICLAVDPRIDVSSSSPFELIQQLSGHNLLSAGSANQSQPASQNDADPGSSSSSSSSRSSRT